MRIGERHPAHADKVDPTFPHQSLRDMGQEVLEVRKARADEGQIGYVRFELPGHRGLPRHPDKGIFGRLVPVGRRKERRPLQVRIIRRAGRSEVDHVDADLFHQLEQPFGLTQIVFRRVVGAYPETVWCMAGGRQTLPGSPVRGVPTMIPQDRDETGRDRRHSA